MQQVFHVMNAWLRFSRFSAGLHLCKRRINHCVDINLIFQLHIATSSWARCWIRFLSSRRHMTINFSSAFVCFSAPLNYPSTLLPRRPDPNAKCNYEYFLRSHNFLHVGWKEFFSTLSRAANPIVLHWIWPAESENSQKTLSGH